MCRRTAAPRIRGVNNVIVKKGTRLDQLQGTHRTQHRLRILRTTHARITCPGKQRSQPLPTTQHKLFQHVHSLWLYTGQVVALLGKKLH